MSDETKLKIERLLYIIFSIPFALGIILLIFLAIVTAGVEGHIYVVLFAVWWISGVVFCYLSEFKYAKRVDILGEEIIFTPKMGKKLVFKICDIKSVRVFYRRGGSLFTYSKNRDYSYYFVFKSRKRVYVAQYFEFYINGQEFTRLFRDYFGIEP